MKPIVVILSILLLASCKKDKQEVESQYSVKGKVIDMLSGLPVPGAKVTVIGYARVWGIARVNTLKPVTSDGSGEFRINIGLDINSYNYMIYAQGEQHASQDRYYQKYSLKFDSGRELIQDIPVMPYAYLKLRVKGNKGGQLLELELDESPSGSYYNGTDTLKTYKIPYSEVIIISMVTPSGGGSPLQSVDTIPLIPSDTTHFLLEF